MADPWASFRTDAPPAPQTPASATPQPQAPVVGPPIFQAAPDPLKQSAEERARQDQEMQAEALRLSRAAAQRAAAADARSQAEFEGTAGKPTEVQGKAAAFLIRALGADRAYGDTGENARNIFAQALQDARPNIANTLINADSRQVANSAQDEFIAASLRQDSGAAIPPEEMERQRRIYFPMPGDSEAAVEQKRQARMRAIEGLRMLAGPLRADAEQRFAALEAQFAKKGGAGGGGSAPEPDAEGFYWRNTDDSGADLGGVFDAAGKPLGPDGGMGFDKAGNEIGLFGSTTDESPVKPLSARTGERTEEGSIFQTVDAAVRGVADVVTFGLADEIAAAGDTVFGGGTMEQNLALQKGVDRFDEQNNFKARLGGQVAGGFLLPASRAKGALQGAGVGAAYGGAYGFGSADGDIGDRLAGAATGALVGGGVGGVAGKFLNPKARPPGGSSGPTPREIYGAAQRQGVDVMPADVGGPTTRLGTAAFGATPGGTYPITTGAQRTVTGAEQARDRIAQMFGNTAPDELAGQIATEGALKYRSSSRDAIGRLYERAARETTDARIEPQRALQALDANIAELAAIPGSQVGALQGLREEIVKLGPLSVQGIRGMRTQLRDRFMKEGLVGSDLERRVNQVVEAAAEDLAEGLAGSGLIEQASLLREADRQWRERAQTMQEVILPIIGKRGERSGEQVFRSLQAASQGNNSRFVKFMESLPENERNTISASIIGALGRGPPAEGGAFSLGKFFTDWGNLGETARRAILPPQARAALDDLATIAEARKRAERSLNRSNTGLVATTFGTAALDSLVTMGATVAGQFGVGRLLSSPLVTRALVKFTRAKTPEARARILRSFDEIAEQQPAAANDIAALQDNLLRSVSGR